MSKTSFGCLFSLVSVGVCAPGLALAVGAVAGVGFAGQWVGEHPVLLTLYIVGAMVIAYGVPAFIALAAAEKNILMAPVALVAGMLATAADRHRAPGCFHV